MASSVRLSSRRLRKELARMKKTPTEGIEVEAEEGSDNWVVTLHGAKGTLYEGESFKLAFQFSAEYPHEAPIVVFMKGHIPTHPHVYSNGHICLSILYDAWSPALTVSSVCLSILSMLSSAPKKEPPSDNKQYVMLAPSNPKKTRWDFHDDKA